MILVFQQNELFKRVWKVNMNKRMKGLLINKFWKDRIFNDAKMG